MKNVRKANGFCFVNSDKIPEGHLYKDRLHLLEAHNFINGINNNNFLLKHRQKNYFLLKHRQKNYFLLKHRQKNYFLLKHRQKNYFLLKQRQENYFLLKHRQFYLFDKRYIKDTHSIHCTDLQTLKKNGLNYPWKPVIGYLSINSIRNKISEIGKLLENFNLTTSS